MNTRKTYRTLPLVEQPWSRGGDLVRVKLIDLEAALPPAVKLEKIRSFQLVAHRAGNSETLPIHLDYADGFGRWVRKGNITPNTQICFTAPAAAGPAHGDWAGSARFEGRVDLALWDSRGRSELKGLSLYYSTRRVKTERPPSALRLKKDKNGYSVCLHGQKLLHFDAGRSYQIDFATRPGGAANLVPPNRTWRWLLTETTAELAGSNLDQVSFTPIVKRGPVLVVTLNGQSPAGQMTATLRIFIQRDSLVLEFADYRAIRTRPELSPDLHPRCYAGQVASPYPGVHYAAFFLESDSASAKIYNHLYKYQALSADQALTFTYDQDKSHYPKYGAPWLALKTEAGTVALSSHNRTHFPDPPFKHGSENGRTLIALEPFGSEVNGHYHSLDRHLLILTGAVDQVRETFDTLDTWPLLVDVPLARELAFLDTFECLRKWVDLNLDYLMKEGHYHNALKTDGTFVAPGDTCMVPFGEMIRLYEKTGWRGFLDTASQAATFVSDWIIGGQFNTRGIGVGPNGGGIYQNEQIYLLLSLARVYRHTHDERLLKAIDFGIHWMLEHRGEDETWGWTHYLWHAGGYGPDGKALFYWPVNTNQFATLNFRLYQLLGLRRFYDQALTIVQDYLGHIQPDSHEIIKGGGVSDTTRGVHLLAEIVECCVDEPAVDRAFFAESVRTTQERFWVEGWGFVRHSIYGEVLLPGEDAPEIFSPGYHHWHNCGSHLDILPRMQVAAEVGVSEELTRTAMRDFALDFDVRYGLEEHTHLARYSMRDTDIEPACWLDCELMPTLFAVKRRGWMCEPDFRLLHYKIHQMVQRRFISLDKKRGGWAATYDSHEGEPIKYLAYWIERHSHERFAAGEPLEMWGFTTRDAFYDHSTHYWNAPEQLVDELLRVAATRVEDRQQRVKFADEGPAADLPIARPALIPVCPGGREIVVEGPWRLLESRRIKMAGRPFWLIAVLRTES